MAASPGQLSKAAVTRLQKDLVRLQRAPNPQFTVRPSEHSLLEWHFVLHDLPKDTLYSEGCYHGKILFPADYPLSPPGIMMITPSGRLEVNQRLCLSMTDFHPESWNPAWSTETILVGLLSFFLADKEKGYGCIVRKKEVRLRLAAESWEFNGRSAEFAALFPEFLQRAPGSSPGVAGVEQPEGHSEQEEGEVQQPSPASSEAAQAVSPAAASHPKGAAGSDPMSTSAAGDMRLPLLQVEASTATPSSAATAPWLAAEAGGPGEQRPGARVVPAEGGAEQHDGPAECWICRDDNGEPLIHPCRCRGTMSGVHASCVNEWVAHSRRRAVDAAAPRCSVCHEPYGGQEERPGVAGFFRHMCANFAQTALRVLLYAGLALLFQASAAPQTTMPIWLRVIILTVCSVVWLVKIMMLMLSIPIGAGAPRHAALRRLHTENHEVLSKNIAELAAGAMCLGFWTVIQVVDWHIGVPFLVVATIPLIKGIMLAIPWGAAGPAAPLRCVLSVGMLIGSIVVAPFVCLFAVGSFVVKNPRRVLTPLGATWHVVVAIATFPLCLVCASNLPVLVMWGVHEVYLLVALADLLGAKRWRWREGLPWGFALQISALAAYVSNVMCVFPQGVGGKKYSSLIVLCASLVWLLTLTVVALLVNKSIIVYYYNVWQSRHGNFTLRVMPDGTPEGQEGSADEQPVAGQDPATVV